MIGRLQLPFKQLCFFSTLKIYRILFAGYSIEGYFTFMLNLIVLNESQVLKIPIEHMLCGTSKALLTSCEANMQDLEHSVYIREENFGQAHQP